MSQLTVNVTGLLTLERQLKLLALPSGKQRVLLSKVARKSLTGFKKHVAKQTDVEGSAYAPRRKRRKDRKKMLSGLARNLKVTFQSATESKIGFSNGLMAYIAAKQQYGFTETVTAASLNRNANANRSNSGMATRQQAAKLLSLGYLRRNGSRPSIKWITQNMPMGQAGLLVRILRTDSPKSSWQTKLPARSFVGMTEDEAKQYINLIFDQMLGAL
jgi:hypothetical protein